VRVLELLRAFAADYTYVNRRLASWLGVHTADAAAYAEILYAQDRGAPMTPALLARRLAMTSGATTSLLNRLEGAGLVVRSREHRDRRVVTLRSDPAIKKDAPQFFGPLGDRLDAVMSEYTPEFLDHMTRFLERVHDGMTDFIERVDDDVPPRHGR
jgi:DNA-binding MarR family transcriptional regulator